MFEQFFSPRSIAIIGASSNPEKIGYAILKNLASSGYSGSIYPVNPNSSEIMGLKAYSSITQIPGSVDLTVIALPASKTPGEVRECVRLKVPYVIIIPGGFSETGEEGRTLENRISMAIAGSDTRIIGPNTVGVYFPHTRVNTALTPPDRISFPPPGNIAFISQSGALGLLTMDSISEYGIGVSAFVNLGNKLDVNELEMISHFSTDPNTGSIALYLESIESGRKFFDLIRDVNRRKPIVVLKSGRSEASARAASLHTGAMASDDRVLNGALCQAGVARAFDETELLDYARVLAYARPFSGNRIAVVTTAGGVGVISADLISSKINGIGLKMASLSAATKQGIRESIVAFGTAENPIDLTADGSLESYDQVLSALEAEREVDAILAYALPQTPKMSMGIVEVVDKHINSGKAIVVGVIGSKLGRELLLEFEKKKIAAFPSIQRSVKALKVLHDYGKYMKDRGYL